MNHLKQTLLLLPCIVTVLMMAGCGGTPGSNVVQKTEQDYHKASRDTQVVRQASKELREAKKAVNKLKKSSKNVEDSTAFKRQLVLADQRIKIARTAADLRAAQTRVKKLSGELGQLRVHVNKIEDARREARLASMSLDERAKYLQNFQVLHKPRGLILRFRGVTFNSSEASLSYGAEGPINELTELLNQFPERRILIEGFTDSTGPATYNKKLSQQRADAVRKALLVRHIDSARVQAKGLGEKYPIANNKYKEGRERNRRVEVIISNKSGVIQPRKQEGQ